MANPFPSLFGEKEVSGKSPEDAGSVLKESLSNNASPEPLPPSPAVNYTSNPPRFNPQLQQQLQQKFSQLPKKAISSLGELSSFIDRRKVIILLVSTIL